MRIKLELTKKEARELAMFCGNKNSIDVDLADNIHDQILKQIRKPRVKA